LSLHIYIFLIYSLLYYFTSKVIKKKGEKKVFLMSERNAWYMDIFELLISFQKLNHILGALELGVKWLTWLL